MEQVAKCPICGEPYMIYMYYAVNQSACPECLAKARAKMSKGNVVVDKEPYWIGGYGDTRRTQ